MATVRSVAKKLRDAMGVEAGKAAAPLVTTTMPGTVVAIDGKGNATVDMGNGQQATVMLGIGAHEGDHVDVEFGGMSAVATRNRTDPPDNAIARDAEKVADEAAAVANATGQHFWDDGNGVHVADESRDDWDEEWAKSGHGSIGTPTSQRPWHNILMNSLGLLLRTGVMNLVGITRSAVAFYDGLGNAAGNITARFGADGEQIGKLDESHMTLDFHSVKMVDYDDNVYFHVSDLRDEDNVATLVETFAGDGTTVEFTVGLQVYGEVSAVDSGDATNAATRSGKKYTFAHAPSASSTVTITYETRSDYAKAYTLGIRGDGNLGAMSCAEGYNNVADGFMSHAEGNGTRAAAPYSHAEGWATRAAGNASHAEGEAAKANADYSHAEGWSAKANGRASHAEGYLSEARGDYSHAEGHSSLAYGDCSHAEGNDTDAYGDCSHAQNRGTIANGNDQTAIGRFNKTDLLDRYAFIIGNGTADDARSNALAVRWNGLVDQAGRTAYPLFIYNGKPTEASAPVTPCFIYDTSDGGLYHYSG